MSHVKLIEQLSQYRLFRGAFGNIKPLSKREDSGKSQDIMSLVHSGGRPFQAEGTVTAETLDWAKAVLTQGIKMSKWSVERKGEQMSKREV